VAAGGGAVGGGGGGMPDGGGAEVGDSVAAADGAGAAGSAEGAAASLIGSPLMASPEFGSTIAMACDFGFDGDIVGALVMYNPGATPTAAPPAGAPGCMPVIGRGGHAAWP
jgi:hypothetical protein